MPPAMSLGFPGSGLQAGGLVSLSAPPGSLRPLGYAPWSVISPGGHRVLSSGAPVSSLPWSPWSPAGDVTRLHTGHRINDDWFLFFKGSQRTSEHMKGKNLSLKTEFPALETKGLLIDVSSLIFLPRKGRAHIPPRSPPPPHTHTELPGASAWV